MAVLRSLRRKRGFLKNPGIIVFLSLSVILNIIRSSG
jgi:hypothetical protein